MDTFFPKELTFGTTLFYIFLLYFIAYIFVKIYENVYDVQIIKCSNLKWKDIDPFYQDTGTTDTSAKE